MNHAVKTLTAAEGLGSEIPSDAAAVLVIGPTESLLPEETVIQVDGGIGLENVRAVHEAGASLLVAGTSIFGREDLPRAYRRLVQALA